MQEGGKSLSSSCSIQFFNTDNFSFLVRVRFEAEISGVSGGNPNQNGLFIPPQLRPIIGSNTYKQVQQKLQQHPPTMGKPPPALNHQHMINVPPPAIPPPMLPPPSFIPTFSNNAHPEKSYNSEPTPIVLSSAPKLYTNRLGVNPTETPVPQVCCTMENTILHTHAQI